jgi:hypothetical protein
MIADLVLACASLQNNPHYFTVLLFFHRVLNSLRAEFILVIDIRSS